MKKVKISKVDIIKALILIIFILIGLMDVLIIKRIDNFNLKDYTRKITKIESDTIIDDAFLILSSNHEVMASITEKGKIIGIITIEDILEEVIGNVFDEYN